MRYEFEDCDDSEELIESIDRVLDAMSHEIKRVELDEDEYTEIISLFRFSEVRMLRGRKKARWKRIRRQARQEVQNYKPHEQ